jgi:hypothetical protein
MTARGVNVESRAQHTCRPQDATVSARARPVPPADARTVPPTHPRWVLRTAPPAGEHFPREGFDSSPSSDDTSPDEMPSAPTAWGQSPSDNRDDSDELRCAALPPVEFDGVPLGAAQRPSFDHATLSALCREASDIGYQLAVSYATALTFRKAVREVIPPSTRKRYRLRTAR